MARYGKPDRKGRSSGRHGGRIGKLHRPPKGEPFVWLTRELVASPAWRAQSINCRRFVDFLLIEHMNHAGTMNGELKAPYNQLEAFSLTRECICEAIEEAISLGLVRRLKQHYRLASEYALTWLPVGDQPPTNDWKRTTEETVEKLKRDRAECRRAKRASAIEGATKNRSAGAETRTQQVRKAAPDSSESKPTASPKAAESFTSEIGRPGAESRTAFYISRGKGASGRKAPRRPGGKEFDPFEIPDFLRRPRGHPCNGADA